MIRNMLTPQQKHALETLQQQERDQDTSPLLDAVRVCSNKLGTVKAACLLDLVAAMLVVVKDEKIRLHLAITDPQALKQCERALGLPLSQKFVRVEYDPEYLGGEYDGVGQFDLISFDVINEAKRLYLCDDDQALRMAFLRLHPNLSTQNIIRYTFDKPKNVDGEDMPTELGAL